MQLARIEQPDGRTEVVRIDGDEGVVVDAPDVVGAAVLHLGGAGPRETDRRVSLRDEGVRVLAPVGPSKLLAIGFNYAEHIDEAGGTRPEHPIFFNKQTTCVVGPGVGIEVPPESTMVDYEVELAVVIGRRCRRVAAADALDVVAGYLIANDVSVRDWQLRAPTMTLGKGWDTHGPLGPWLTTADEVPDPQALRLRCFVNDELLQDGTTADMLFTVAEQIEVLSTMCTLEPGDVISTGTPSGVGIARTPPRWLVPGDVCRLEIDGLGVLENPVIAG
jgi:2-keto-4-pentenoate hydratase/2-oxohepta-3-ene-1,7-dioic acid hydratase in catechol pathway